MPRGLFDPNPEQIDILKRRWNQGFDMPEVNELRPDLPPRPAGFEKDVLTGGSKVFARGARKLIDIDPRIKTKLTGIQFGPNTDSMREMVKSGMDAESYVGTNLLGQTNPRTGKISLNPALTDKEALETLVHELSHLSPFAPITQEISANFIDQEYRKAGPTPNTNWPEFTKFPFGRPGRLTGSPGKIPRAKQPTRRLRDAYKEPYEP